MKRLPAQCRDRRPVYHLQMVPAYAWIARKWLRRRFSRGCCRTCIAVRSVQVQQAETCEQPGLRQLVVVGDSLAAGLGDPVAGLTLVGWADRLALSLMQPCPHMGYSNLAVSGLTTSQIAAGQLAAVRALAPDLIILCAGGNDLLARRWDPGAFRSAYAVLLGGLIGTGATVLTATWHNLPLAVSMPAAFAQRYSQRLAEASAIVRDVSEALGAVCVDFWHMPELLDARCYSGDGTHPNARGYLRVAQVLAGVVARQTGITLSTGSLYHDAERDPAPTRNLSIASRLVKAFGLNPLWAIPKWTNLGFGVPRREVEV